MLHAEILLIAASVLFCSAVSIDDKKRCTPYETCADCIVKGGGYCYYCEDENYQDNANARRPRCNVLEELEKNNCASIIRQDTETKLIENDEVRDTKQVQPQKVHLNLRIGQPATFKLKVKSADNYPVDLYYLMDLSNSMKDDLGNLTKLAEGLAAAIGEITTEYRFGFGSFVDKPLAPYIRLDLKKKPCEGCAATFGYKHSLKLSKNIQEFKETVKSQNISSNLDSPEGGFDALMQATVCGEKIGWYTDINKARRIVIFVTDAYPHIAGDGRLAGIVTPNDGQCHMKNDQYDKSEEIDYPSIAFLKNKMKENKILPIIATTSDVMNVYKKIAEEWKDIGAVAAELEGDSSNIIELVKAAYKEISQTARVTAIDAPEEIHVKAESNCIDGGGSDTCKNVQINSTVEFDVSVTGMLGLCEKIAKGMKKEFSINVAGFGDVKVTFDAICECDCKSKGVPKSKKCNETGTHACGICYCDEGRFGATCNCTDATSADTKNCMSNATDPNGKVCSGFGKCICGKCVCDTHEGSERVTSGIHCECNNFGCELFKGELCGGSTRGKCECGKCQCIGDQIGSNCGLKNCKIAVQQCKKNGKVCGGNGRCIQEGDKCGKCICNTGYAGSHCETCVSCPGKCKTVQDCVLCVAFNKEGVQDKSVCDKCSFLNWKYVNKSEECSVQVNETCYVDYQFEKKPEKGLNETVYVQREKRCLIIIESKPNILAIILGTIGGIVLLGLLLLLLWKLLITAYDNYEYHKFEKDRMKSKWEQAENPIYRPSKQQFKNPAYAGAQQ